MSGLTGNNILAGSSGQGRYEIKQSLRFNNTGESVYLERTPSADGNKQVATLSFWIKNCGVSDSGATDNTRIMYAGNSSSDVSIWQVTHTFAKFEINNYRSGPGNGYWTTDAQYRDRGAWYHYVVSYNQGTVNTYVNGELQSQSVTIGGWSGAVDTAFNSNGVLMVVGPKTTTASVKSIYLAEYHWIDGQALTPSDFGETDLLTNQWIPKKYVGTYGTNGFYLNFSDSASLGADSSGNGNNFTPTNLAATDQVLDSPTNNFATLNPLIKSYGTTTFSEGNLKVVCSAAWNATMSGISVSSGKWYWEVYQDSATTASNNGSVGIWAADNTLAFNGGLNPQLEGSILYYGYDGQKRIDGTFSSYGATFTAGDIIGVALDLDSGTQTITFYKNNSSQGVINLSGACSTSSFVVPGNAYYSSTVVMNFGQDSSFAGAKTAQGNTDGNGKGYFYHAPPSGYLALCTANLPDPSIADPTAQFNTVLYTGDGTAGNAITCVGFSADFIWIKNRTAAYVHNLADTVRGITKGLSSNLTNAENSFGNVQSVQSDGFTVGANALVNGSGENLVSWNWKANGSGVSNTDGTITSTVSANTTAGFSIVSYNTGGTSVTVGHGLNKTPELIIIKNRDDVSNWLVWHEGLSSTNHYTILNSTAAEASGVTWSPTSTTFSAFHNQSHEWIAYCFYSVEGYSKFGSYTGNGSTNGPFVYTGFRPAFVMWKQINSARNWAIMDSARDSFNKVDRMVWADLSNAEVAVTTDEVDFLSNGFKMRLTGSTTNQSGGTYIYMAFAESPFKYSNAR